MGKIRVYELAKKLGTTSKKLIEVLAEMDVPVKNHMSAIEEEVAQKLMTVSSAENKVEEDSSSKADTESVSETEKKAGKKAKDKTEKKSVSKEKSEPVPGRKARKAFIKKSQMESDGKGKRKEVVLEGRTTVGEMGLKLDTTTGDILTFLLDFGIVSNINQELNDDIIELLAEEYDVDIVYQHTQEEKELINYEKKAKKEDMVSRFPVVAVLGHVDHGKTSLLDKIRKSNVTAGEAGGITQHIGAYKVMTGDKGVVFLDTPGHEAFTSMRARGAQATDIAIIVVAADDGVMPQTIEAINHVKAAGVSIIVAINKTDKPNANIERVKQQLSEQELVPEEWGGDTICVPVSAIKGEGIEDLLEMILLVSEMNNYKTSPKRLAKGIVIEAKLDKGRGPVATVLIQEGVLKTSHPVICGSVYGKVRAMSNDRGEKVTEADSSTPVEIVGLHDVPQAGDKLQVVNDEKFARNLSEKRSQRVKEAARQNPRVSLDELFSQIQKGEVKDLNLIIKGDVQGSVEALQDSLLKLSLDEVKIKIIHSGVGAINESDVMLATASNAAIIGFNVRPDMNARKMAEIENVDIRSYRIIYEVIEAVKAAVTGLLDPEFQEVVQGVAEIRQVFKSSRFGTIAGSYITEGKIIRNNSVRLLRNSKTVHEGKIASLKRFQEDVKEVVTGYECGIVLENYNDLKEGDMLEAYSMEEIKRT